MKIMLGTPKYSADYIFPKESIVSTSSVSIDMSKVKMTSLKIFSFFVSLLDCQYFGK